MNELLIYMSSIIFLLFTDINQEGSLKPYFGWVIIVMIIFCLGINLLFIFKDVLQLNSRFRIGK